MKNKAKEIYGRILGIILFAFVGFLIATYFLETSGADERLTAVIDFIIPWIQRFGGVVMLIGMVVFGHAYKNDAAAEGKAKGRRIIIAGGIIWIVLAVYTTLRNSLLV